MAKEDIDDRELVRLMLRGDEAAFAQFFDRQFPALFRFAMSRLGYDADLAEDVVQATLIQATRKLATFRGEAALFTWLCTFCRHEISAVFRRRKKHQLEITGESDALEAALASLAAPDSDQPDAALRHDDLRSRVRAALDRLPSHYGRALAWKYLEDLPVREIASRLDIGSKAAESLLTRARQAFRTMFSRDEGAQDNPKLSNDVRPLAENS